MILFAALFRTGIFAEGRFLGKVLDEWIVDGQEFLHAKLPHLLTILVITLILSRIITLSTRRMVAVAERGPASPGHRSQVKTVAGVLRTTLNAVLWTLTALQMLTILGVNLGPLLASAGVAGIALGLAAQTIVKDLLNGTLILLEDQFNVGDLVRLTGMSGVVEAMTLRRTEIRDSDGTLYVVPNSQITTVANLSRDFTLVNLPISIDISVSPERAMTLLRRLAMEFRNDPEYKELFLTDPVLPGVDAIKGSEVVYPVIFRVQPARQVPAMREFRRRLRIALEAEGVLPGDPYRVFHGFDGQALGQAAQGSLEGQAQAQPAAVDPTALPAAAHDLFGAE